MADKRQRVSSPHVPEPPPGTFSRAIRVGNQLFVAGMTANSPNGIEGGDSMYEQTRAVFRKIQHLVEAAGGSMNDIVKMTGFITDIKQREDYLRARRDFFTADPPASTLVEITALAAPGLLIEVEVMAVLGSHRGGGPRNGPPHPPTLGARRQSRRAPRPPKGKHGKARR